MGWTRDYFILKTGSGDAIALAQRLCPSGDSAVLCFTLWYPEHEGTEREFLEVIAYTLSFEEYTTHRDAFKTLEEVDIVRDQYDSTTLTRELLVAKK